MSDTGAGIARDDIPHIFERFYKVDRSRGYEGTGLGLAIVKRIIEQHEGHLRLEDINQIDYSTNKSTKKSKGAKISIIFPVRSESSKSGKI